MELAKAGKLTKHYWLHLYLVLFIVLLSGGSPLGAEATCPPDGYPPAALTVSFCPRRCQCQSLDHNIVVNCSGAGLKSKAVSKLRLPCGVQKLLLDSNQIDFIGSDTFKRLELQNLTHLSITRNNISVIQADAFQELENLQELDLSFNFLETLPEKVFSGTNLTTLHLHNNPLTGGGLNDSLKYLQNLEYLDVADTRFCYKNVTEDTVITMLPSNFVHLKNLQYLDLQETCLRSLRDYFFHPVKDAPLRQLSLAGNKLVDGIDNSTFAVLQSLEFLDLSRTFVGTLATENIFTGLRNSSIDTILLVSVYILDDPDRLVKQHMFGPLEDTNLRVLHLENNGRGLREQIAHRLFKHLPSLEELYLDHCMLEVIDYQAFHRLDNLEILSLRDNFLSCVQGCEFLDAPYVLASLKRLDLSKNVISGLGGDKGVFQGRYFPVLRWLDLSNNRLTTLQRGIFVHLNRLIYLDLSMNPLVSVAPGTFHSLPFLQTLQINSCIHLQHLKNGTFKGMSQLASLNLENNNLQRLDQGAFVGLRGLHALNLRANRLETLDVKVVFANLTILNLGQNLLQQLPHRLLQNVSGTLQSLYIDHNRLFGMDCGDEGNLVMSEIKDIDASHNSIPRIDSETISTRFPNLRSLNLAGNPFLCDCHLNQSFSELREGSIELLDKSEYYCSEHSSSGRRNIFQFEAPVWHCRAQAVVLPMLCFVTGGMVVGFFVVVVFYYQRRKQALLQECEDGEEKASSPWCIPLRPLPTRHKMNGDVESHAASEHLLQADGQAETIA